MSDTYFEYTKTDDGKGWIITYYSGQEYKLDIPSEHSTPLDGTLPVVSLADSLFYDNSYLGQVHIPGSIKEISSSCFDSCANLVSVRLDEGIEKIGSSAFRGCINLSMIDIPNSVTNIGEYAFSGSNLEAIALGKSVTTIGGYAFYQCYRLASIDIPDSVITIGDSAFEYCSFLTSITFGANAKTIGKTAFKGCDGITDITLNPGLESIGDYAFEDCRGLTSLIIPESVTTIGERITWGCTNLSSIFCEAAAKPDGWHTSWHTQGALVYWYSRIQEAGKWHYGVEGFKISCDPSENMIDSKYFKVSQEGEVEGSNCKFINGTFIGDVTADTGQIGDFKIINGSLTSDTIQLTSSSIFFPIQSTFNLGNDVTLYNEEDTSYISTLGNKDFIIKNSAGAGIKFYSSSPTEKIQQNLILSNFSLKRITGPTQNLHGYTYTTYYYDVYFDAQVLLNGSQSVLFQPYSAEFYIKYAFVLGASTTKTSKFSITMPAATGKTTFSVRLGSVMSGVGVSGSYRYDACSIDGNSWGSSITYNILSSTSNNNVLYSLGNFSPDEGEKYYLGTEGHCWNTIRLHNSPIIDSDSRKKNSISKVYDNYSILFDNLNPVVFRYNTSDSNRLHTGFIAQEVEQALNKANIEVKDFAGLCIGTDENKTYSLRYEEFIPLNTYEIQKLKSRVKELESIVEELRCKIK